MSQYGIIDWRHLSCHCPLLKVAIDYKLKQAVIRKIVLRPVHKDSEKLQFILNVAVIPIICKQKCDQATEFFYL